MLASNWNATNTSYALVSEPLWSANFSAYNSSWSSITNTSYYLQTNPFGFYNSTNPPTETLWNANYSTFLTHVGWDKVINGTMLSQATFNTNYSTLAKLSDANVFTENQTMEGIKFEGDTTNHVMFDNSTCIFIKGDTSEIQIC